MSAVGAAAGAAAAPAGGASGRATGAAAVTVAVHGLEVGYAPRGGTAPVLAGLEFALAPGERLAVVGRSGGGKSTLLHVLAGLLPPSAGQVLVDGRQAAAADFGGRGRPGCRPGHAAYMFQQDLLLPWKRVLDNTTFAAQVARGGGRARRRWRTDGGVAGGGLVTRAAAGAAGLEAAARTLLEEFGLGDALAALPRELSGGMRQRVALARTLMLGRGLVLLDEPLGSLDALTRAEMRAWLLEAMDAHPATWVLVTHDVHEAVLLGDRVAVLAGRPARLHGWVEVPVSRPERRRLAALEAGETAADPAAAAVAETLSGLAARVRRSLGGTAGDEGSVMQA